MGRDHADKAPEQGWTRPSGQTLSSLTRSVDAFGRTIDQLQADYTELERKHTELNDRPAAVNEELRAALDANRRLADRLDHILDCAPLGFIVIDAGGQIKLCHAAAERMWGLDGTAVLNRGYADVWPGRADDDATALACLQGKAPSRGVRRELAAPDGRRLIVSVSTVTLPSEDGPGPAGAIEVLDDLRDYESLRDELARMRTLAALGELASTVAHEIRNPLGGVLGFAELLARRSKGDPEREHMAERVVTGSRHLMTIVDRMLEFARDPRLSMREIEWRRFCSMSLDQYEENARHRGQKITLRRLLPEKLGTGRGDPICLRQAVWNVLENAEHANGDGDYVTVTVSSLEGNGLRLEVVDSGPGFDPEIAERVFLPFVSGKEKGPGLGLATARKIVEAHGGTIVIRNRVNTSGASVTIELPGGS